MIAEWTDLQKRIRDELSEEFGRVCVDDGYADGTVRFTTPNGHETIVTVAGGIHHSPAGNFSIDWSYPGGRKGDTMTNNTEPNRAAEPTSERTPERTQFLGDIITTAAEGGTGYWAQVSQYQWIDDLGISREPGTIMVVCGERQGDEPRATLHELNDDESGYKEEGLDLTLDAVERGIGLILDGKVGVATRYINRIAGASARNDAGDIDAEDADVIAQAALLGDIVYG